MSDEALPFEQRLARLKPLLHGIEGPLEPLVTRSGLAMHENPADDLSQGAPALKTIREAAKRIDTLDRT